MKKFIIVAIVAMASVFVSQAATVKWQFTGVKGPGSLSSANLAVGNGVINLYYVSESGALTAALTGISLTGAGAHSANSDQLAEASWTPQVYTSTVDGFKYLGLYMEIVGTTDGTQEYKGTSTVKISGAAAALAGQQQLTYTWLNSNITWTAVPEPTSMALLAIGVAALGLKRKFRK